MPKVLLTSFYHDSAPGDVVDLPEKVAKRVVESRGGKIVEGKAVETATDHAAESAETRAKRK